MKKLVMLLVTSLVTLSLFAQTGLRHITFMGIPLDGEMSLFHSQLIKKGLRYDEYIGTKYAGKRFYNGTFAGEKAQIIVEYDERTDIVYQATVAIDSNEDRLTIGKYAIMVNAIERKYCIEVDLDSIEGLKKRGVTVLGQKYTGQLDDWEYTRFSLQDVDSLDMIGTISVNLMPSSNKRDNQNYILLIQYVDSQNNRKQRESNIDDL